MSQQFFLWATSHLQITSEVVDQQCLLVSKGLLISPPTADWLTSWKFSTRPKPLRKSTIPSQRRSILNMCSVFYTIIPCCRKCFGPHHWRKSWRKSVQTHLQPNSLLGRQMWEAEPNWRHKRMELSAPKTCLWASYSQWPTELSTAKTSRGTIPSGPNQLPVFLALLFLRQIAYSTWKKRGPCLHQNHSPVSWIWRMGRSWKLRI